MGVRAEGLPWERQPREGEEAYAAFLAYRDLGPGRTLEATRMHSARGRATSSRSSGGRPAATGVRAGPGTTTCRPSATRSPREEAAKWEQRRLQALEEGWQLCQELRARLEQMLAIPPETPAVAPPEPARERPEALPDAVATPEEAGASAGAGRRGGTTWRWCGCRGWSSSWSGRS